MLRTAYLLGISLLAWQVALPQEAAQQNTSASSSTYHENSSLQKTPKARQSTRAVNMLNDINQARQAITNNDKAQAQKDVKHALKKADKLESKAGSNQVAMIPIFTEFSQISVIGPTLAARQAQPGQMAQSGNASATTNQPSSQQGNAAMTAPAVQNVEGQYSAAFVDPRIAQAHLKAAQEALKNNNLRAADDALRGAQDSLVLASVQSDMPLVQARQNLSLAAAEIDHGQPTQAVAPLNEAARALQSYQGTHQADATELSREISSFARQLGQGAQNASKSEDKQIEGWWDQVSNWITRPQQARR